MINFNQKALEVCQSYGFPLIGNSDAHFLSQLGTTYSLIYAEKNLNSIFAAIRGIEVDGHQFVEEAIERGAEAIVLEEERQISKETMIFVPNSRQAWERFRRTDALHASQPNSSQSLSR
jgi:UDP-N-acetylmuramyl tripeptide synthase